MKFALFGDLHIYKHLSISVFEDVAQSFLYYLLDYCLKNGIDNIIFLGDWFHVKNKLYVPSFIKSIETLRIFREKNINLTFLIGNHDMPQMNTTDHSIIYAFEEYGRVIPFYEWEDIDDNVRFHYLSYTKDLPEFNLSDDKENILFGHIDIVNFVMESGFLCHTGFDVNDFKDFKHAFSGHFHKHQLKKNVVYVGSPYQTRYSERNDHKGFVVYDTDTLDWKFEVYKDAPTFKEVNIDDYNPEDIKGNFVRIRTHKSNEDLNEIKNALLALGAETVDFIFEDDNEEKELNMIEDLTMGSMNELASAFWDEIREQELFDDMIAKLIDKDKLKKDDFMSVFSEIEEASLSNWKPESDEEKILLDD